MEVFDIENLKGIHSVQWNILIYTDCYFQQKFFFQEIFNLLEYTKKQSRTGATAQSPTCCDLGQKECLTSQKNSSAEYSSGIFAVFWICLFVSATQSLLFLPNNFQGCQQDFSHMGLCFLLHTSPTAVLPASTTTYLIMHNPKCQVTLLAGSISPQCFFFLEQLKGVAKFSMLPCSTPGVAAHSLAPIPTPNPITTGRAA